VFHIELEADDDAQQRVRLDLGRASRRAAGEQQQHHAQEARRHDPRQPEVAQVIRQLAVVVRHQ